MKPPKSIPTVLVAIGESFARDAGIPVDDFWAYLLKRKAPPPELRRGLVETFFPRVSPDDFLSTSHPDGSTIRTMRTEEFAAPRRGRRSPSTHPLFVALAEHGITLADEAEAVKRSTSSIRSFCYPKGSEHWRPAPEDLKKRWADLYGVPAKTWR